MAVVPVVLWFSCVFLAQASLVHGGVDEILEYKFTQDRDGGYFYRFKTSNGIEREETGEILEDAKDSVILRVVGYYKYLRENGRVEEVKYRAGENGFSVIPSSEQPKRLKQNLSRKQQDPDEEEELPVGPKIDSCVIASLCGTAPYGG